MDYDGSGKLSLNFEAMNEVDVREIIVRPLLHRLGYRHGTEANIRTEVTLRYAKAFLGRKSPRKDPPLVGRADYVCEVISYGRWVVEVKNPSENLERDTIEQAHTYAAHPEIAATYIMLTNGRRFQLYRTGLLDSPILEWTYETLEETALPLFNIVGPAAIKKLSERMTADAGKPLGRGIRSTATIVGGLISYEEHHSDTPLMPNEMIDGLQLPVTGGLVRRLDDGRLHAHVEVAKAAAMFRDFGELVGANDDYDFYSADEYISDDPESPTIFQNVYESRTPAGKMVMVPGLGRVALPFGYQLKAYTEAVGFLDAGVFRGTMRLDYDLTVIGMSPTIRPLIEQTIGELPDHSIFSGLGSFEVHFAD